MALAHILHQNNLTSDTDRTRSPAIWGDCPWAAIKEGFVDGVCDGDEFMVVGDENGNDTGGYERYIDTSNTILQLAVDTTAHTTGSRGGVLRMLNDGTDNDGPVIQRGGATSAGQYLIGNASGAAWKTWYECRVRISSIADDVAALFAGLFQTGAAADNGVLTDDTGDIVDSTSCIGFRTLHVNSGTTGLNASVDFVYQDSAQTAPTVAATAIHTLVASTWVKLGFVYDPFAPAAKKIKIFVNNREQSSYITTTNIDASTFPESDALLPAFAQKAGTGTASNFDIDWWYIAQMYSGF